MVALKFYSINLLGINALQTWSFDVLKWTVLQCQTDRFAR